MNTVVDHLRRAVGAEHCLTDPQVLESFSTDWSGRFRGEAICVVRPATTEEISDVVRICAQFGAPIVPQGGNTGLVGGSVPGEEPAVIVSMRRLSWMSPVDSTSGHLTVGAGATLAEVQRHAEEAGWLYGVDLAARESATIGGTIATNAGGIHVIGRGMTRAQLLGIEAVLPDASVVSHLGGLMKDNTGLDLAGLLCGSEGTLGIITAATLRLHRSEGPTSLALVGVADFDAAIALMDVHREAQKRLVAAEVLDAACMTRVVAHAGLPKPLIAPHPVVALIEVADGGDGSGLQLDGNHDVVVALDRPSQERLWRYREQQGEAWSALGICHRVDVSIPLTRMQSFIDEMHALLPTLPEVVTFGFFGHIGDGNIHAEVIGPAATDTRVDDAILDRVIQFGGSISAEHGIGRAKVNKLPLNRSESEVRAMRAIKDALDPEGIMNPGVLFPIR